LWALTPSAQHRDSYAATTRSTDEKNSDTLPLRVVASPQHQVICITHLPQIAAFGDTHFKIHKEIVDERTITKIEELNSEQRIDEIANMLGTGTATTRQNAEELLVETESSKQKAVARKQ
jgi:hypothetical protein